MKKIILFLLLVLVGISASARKSYITISTNNYDGDANSITIRLSGDVPDNIEGFQYNSYSHTWIYSSSSSSQTKSYSTGEVLNLLSEYGYEVESMTPCGNSNSYVLYLLSKEISSGQTINKGDVNTDGEINIADVNEVISLILGIVREHPEILEQIKKQTNH